jgi:hypothetical protein
MNGSFITTALFACLLGWNALAAEWTPATAKVLVRVHFKTVGGITYAFTKATVPDSCHRVAFVGPVKQEGNEFLQEIRYEVLQNAEQLACAEVITVLESVSALGALAAGNYTFSITSFGIVTETVSFSVEPTEEKTIDRFGFNADGQFKLHVNGVFPLVYSLESSTDLKTWVPVMEIQGGSFYPASDPGAVIVSADAKSGRRFYRLKVISVR